MPVGKATVHLQKEQKKKRLKSQFADFGLFKEHYSRLLPKNKIP